MSKPVSKPLHAMLERLRSSSFRLLLLISCSASFAVAHAHSGGLNKDGCHTNRATGDYHCHNGVTAPAPRSNVNAAPAAPVRAVPMRSSGDSQVFANCSQARAAGAAPVRRGDPGYGSHLDRDNDGVGCEPRR